MNNTIRIRTTVGEKNNYVKVLLSQNFDTIDILSLKITQDNTYPLHCADYGILVGRVTVNGFGLGVPNAKVSIFIPLDDDETRVVRSNHYPYESLKISDLYPYKTVTDVDDDGVRYNLLPKTRQNKCHVPVGTFPTKREVLDNNVILEIFEKYYKYTTTTNESGDYMICGIPVGNQHVHIDVDLSDMGVLSQRPHDMMRSGGYPINSFATPTKFKSDKNLGALPQIISENAMVRILPFWGDSDQCEVGVNRYDLNLPYTLEPVAYFIGSIFSDNNKNSVNKHCRARRAVGNICETVTGEGTVEMIRKTVLGHNEFIEINGSRNIDEDGTWVLPVPMNLDNYVTDEFGNLILSEDPTKGIPTRARVRFRVSMDETGGEGRLRTRAKFLVPNNPPDGVEGDYSFGEDTQDKNNNFTDMKWNNIYTVRNFIPRVQRHWFPNGVERRAFIGIKNVDDCGTYTEFPYNRVDSALNPLYIVLCYIMSVLSWIMIAINSITIPILNGVIWLMNQVIWPICVWIYGFTSALHELCFLGICPFEWVPIICLANVNNLPCNSGCRCVLPFIPPIKVDCGESTYAPGFGEVIPDVSGECPPSLLDGGIITDSAQYMNCLKLNLADALNVYKFDFYNDWINGTLYAFLFKYKEKRFAKIKYCAYDCEDLLGPSIGGNHDFHDTAVVSGGGDGNDDGVADNSCWPTHTFDVCSFECNDNWGPSGGGCENDMTIVYRFREGLIKRFNSNLYYASTTHDGFMKLFATDVTLLGNVTECNLDGVPVIHQFLLPTTYQLPPTASNDGGDMSLNIIENGGLFSQDYNEDGVTTLDPLLMSITCSGADLHRVHCKNVRLICELGRGLDENNIDPIDYYNGVASEHDGIIDNKEIDVEFVRKALRHMNVTGVTTTNEDDWHNQFRGFSKPNFGYGDAEAQEVLGIGNVVSSRIESASVNGLPYNNSYYFYFGLHPGKTSLEKLKGNYLTDCDFQKDNDFIITYTSTGVTVFDGHDGEITVYVEGGSPQYTATVITNAVTVNNPFVFSSSTNITSTLVGGGLKVGVYTITVVDSNGWTGQITVVLDGPDALSFNITTTNVYTYNGDEGVIDVNYVNGGITPYTINLYGPAPMPVPNLVIEQYTCYTQGCGYSFTGLGVGEYWVEVVDSSIPPFSAQSVIIITQPTQLNGGVQFVNHLVCHGSNTGSVGFYANGGVPPYTCVITANGSQYNVSEFSVNHLSGDTYSATISDSHNQEVTVTQVVNEPTQLSMTWDSTNINCNGGSDGSITVIAHGGTEPYRYIFNNIDYGTTNVCENLIYGTYTAQVEDANGCQTSIQSISLTQPQCPLEMTIDNSISGLAIIDASGGTGGLFGQYKIEIGVIDEYMTGATYSHYEATLIPGLYEFRLTDGHNCLESVFKVIT